MTDLILLGSVVVTVLMLVLVAVTKDLDE